MRICGKCDGAYPLTTDYFAPDYYLEDELDLWCRGCRAEWRAGRVSKPVMKTCSKCEVEKPATTEYFLMDKFSDSLDLFCKICRGEHVFKRPSERGQE